MFLEKFSEDAHKCCVKDRKKALAYKHLSKLSLNFTSVMFGRMCIVKNGCILAFGASGIAFRSVVCKEEVSVSIGTFKLWFAHGLFVSFCPSYY